VASSALPNGPIVPILFPNAFQYSPKEILMTETDENAPKVHHICQTYVEKKDGRGKPSGLQIGKQFQYSTESQAQERAERESRSEGCVGADAYTVIEDPSSGEVGAPSFIARFGTVPDDEAS